MTSTSGVDSTALDSSAGFEKVPATLDTRGRVRTTKEQQRMILAEFERSGVSAAKFARQTGLKYATLAAWVLRERRARLGEGGPEVRLLEAVAEENCGNNKPLVVELPGGARTEIKDAGQAALAGVLLRTLGKSC
jgi:transposase-like protein